MIFCFLWRLFLQEWAERWFTSGTLPPRGRNLVSLNFVQRWNNTVQRTVSYACELRSQVKLQRKRIRIEDVHIVRIGGMVEVRRHVFHPDIMTWIHIILLIAQHIVGCKSGMIYETMNHLSHQVQETIITRHLDSC